MFIKLIWNLIYSWKFKIENKVITLNFKLNFKTEILHIYIFNIYTGKLIIFLFFYFVKQKKTTSHR